MVKVITLWRNIAKIWLSSAIATIATCYALDFFSAPAWLGFPAGIIYTLVAACIWDTHTIYFGENPNA